MLWRIWWLPLLLLALAPACGGGTPTPVSAPTVSFATEDGVALRGHLFGTQGPAVVLSHAYPADQTSWYPFAQRLADEGYRALTYDFRGYGESGGSKEIALIYKDVKAALEYMRGQDIGPVFLIGASMGGTASLMVAAEEEVAGVVALSAPLKFSGLGLDDITRVVEPKLFLAAEGDAQAASAAYQLFYDAKSPKRAVIYQIGAGHGTDLINKVGEGVVADILRFLGENR